MQNLVPEDQRPLVVYRLRAENVDVALAAIAEEHGTTGHGLPADNLERVAGPRPKFVAVIGERDSVLVPDDDNIGLRIVTRAL